MSAADARRAAWSTREVRDAGGVARVWCRAGSGRPVVALHGFTGSGGDWRVVDEVFGQRPVLAPDLPGHAGSAGVDADRSVDALAAWVDAVADRELAGATYDLMGYSFGGRVALTLASRRSHRIGRLVAIGASPGLQDPDARRARREADAARADALVRDGLEAFLEAWARVPLIATQARMRPEDRALLDEARRGHTAAGLAAHLRAAGTGSMRPLHDVLPALTLSIALVTGAEDAKYEAIAADLAAGLPDAVHVRVPGAGHAPHLEAPDRFVARVRPLLEAKGP